MRSCFRSLEMLTVIEVVLIVMPRNVRHVVWPSILKGSTGALRVSHTASILDKVLVHSSKAGALGVRKLSR